ncbi:hypothetical protein TOT_010001058 [Theileria orientalis strain Shintoku]|uniref:Uncharacterized protein n=1 Tax=Theileria orientalis strain Shintoku TaxID=869250 RepID=J4DNV2_THEOR|nr:hypothetical protein TOT_010001058 [Theileria orientalis strain Shintoku]BAM39604.1 hypothetical protein TOT_010001058 [Theileria orientalis strain Shintoku]|eukprot:XP_009689905.1 hypothetical protein TOT_010001058 [Theileria orientalis strain Shintoku]
MDLLYNVFGYSSAFGLGDFLQVCGSEYMFWGRILNRFEIFKLNTNLNFCCGVITQWLNFRGCRLISDRLLWCDNSVVDSSSATVANWLWSCGLTADDVLDCCGVITQWLNFSGCRLISDRLLWCDNSVVDSSSVKVASVDES